MGKRSRRRPEPAPAPVAAAAPRRRTGRPSPEDRPKPPWHPVPLVELCVLVGLVLLVMGALQRDSDRGKLLLVFGMALGSIGGLDTALREHFAGYKSHTTVLSALPAVFTAAAVFFARAALDRGRRGRRGRCSRPPSGRSGGRSCGVRADAVARLLHRGGREAHAAARAAPRDGDLPRPRGDDRLLPRRARARDRPRRPVRRRSGQPPRVVRRARRRPGTARELHGVPAAPQRRGRRRLDAPLRAARWRRRRSRRPGATTCAAATSSARRCSTGATASRSTSETRMAISSR